MGFRESGSALASRYSARILAGRYRLDAIIGSGGAADVHRGFDLRLRRPVAVKLFRPNTGFDTEEAFLSEAMILARLQHTGLVTAYDAGRHDGDAYLVMQLIEGRTLKARIAEGPLSPEATAALGGGLADALAHAHDAGIVHRDVKPSNVILDAFDHPHLTDFGISRLLDATTRTATGTLIGTAAYLSPEQVLGQPVGRPADVYALGLVLLECLTGRLEYDGGPLEAAIARLHRQPGLPCFLPAELAALLRDMTALDEQARPTARDCVLTLAALSADTGPTPHRPAARATGIAASRRPTGDSTSTRRTPLPLPERPVSEAASRAASIPARPRSRVLMAGATAALAAAMAATLAVADGPSHQSAENKSARPATGSAVTSPSSGTSEDGNDAPAPQPSGSHTVSAPAQSVSPAPGNLSGQSVTDGAPTPGTTAPRQDTTDAMGRPATKTTSELADQGKKKASTGQGDEQSAEKATKIKKK
ncbi:serine/threonine protein kinase [Streptomyces zaehneri]|uniref:serine/threonine protein kinase n=1 Tax=Streptomyces zaehneri TaxID=3051180 RepID=UPI0028D549C1|nr:protein kinase [Streptomyces sp. DSM 40713]